MTSFVQDLRFAVRQLRQQPLFTLTVLATLALGLGANTAIFSTLYALTLRQLPYPQADRLMAVHRKGSAASAYWTEVRAWRQATTLQASAGLTLRTWGLLRDGGTQVVLAGMFTPGFFETLGVEPILGRRPAEKDHRQIWLAHSLWRSVFQSDVAIAGRVIQLNEEPYTVAGVLPPSFQFQYQDRTPDLYFPLESGYSATHVIARLRPGVTPTQATEEIRALSQASGEPTARELGLRDLRRELHGGADTPYRLLMAVVAAVLLVACLNLANLLLARFATRLREFAVRASLGASRSRLIRQFLAEAALLAALGAALAIALANMALPLLSDGMGGIFTPRLDAQVLGFLAALALAVIIVLTAAPAFAITRIDLHQAMRPPRAGKLRGALIAGQVAGGFALLTVTALLLLSYANVTSVDPGFTTRDLLIAGVGIPEVRYDTDAKMARFYERALGEMAAIPGVQSVTVASTLPLVNSHGARVRLSNSQAPDTELPLVRIAMVSPSYFETLRVPVKAGRAFHATDREGHPRVAMVNEAFVRTLGSNVGEQLRLSWWNGAHAKWVPWEVVGVAADVHQQALDRPAAPQVYLPLYQFSSEGALFALRARETDHAAVSAAMVKAVHAVDSSIQSIRVRPMLNDIGTSLDERKLTLRLLSAFAIVVLLLCASGLFGLTAYAVRERTRELASRRALGAEASSVIGVVFRHALSWSVLGMAVGMILAWWAARTVRSQLFGVSTGDPMAWAAALVALSLAVTAGCWLPARRAASVDPAVALRNE